jgi:hypothetical protein
MDLADALLSGNPNLIISSVEELEDEEDFQEALSLALSLGDYNTLWYLLEMGSLYSDNLDEFLLKQCGKEGQSLPCDLLQNMDNPEGALKRAIQEADESLALYAINLLYSPIETKLLSGYSSQDYNRAQEYSREVELYVEETLLEATPSFLDLLFPSLPKRLQSNLLLRVEI